MLSRQKQYSLRCTTKFSCRTAQNRLLIKNRKMNLWLDLNRFETNEIAQFSFAMKFGCFCNVLFSEFSVVFSGLTKKGQQKGQYLYCFRL